MANHGDLELRPAGPTRDVHLPFTLQTHVGMVIHWGLGISRYRQQNNQQRYPPIQTQKTIRIPYLANRTPQPPPQGFPLIRSFQDYVNHDWTSSTYAPVTDIVTSCICHGYRLDSANIEGQDVSIRRLQANVDACRDETIDIHRLMKFIQTRTHLDLEQAAAAVVSAFVNDRRLDDAVCLIKELTGVLLMSDMGLAVYPPPPQRSTQASTPMTLLAHLAEKLHHWCRKAGCDESKLGSDPPRDYATLVHLLLRIRSPRAKGRRCLYIPSWLFRAAEIAPPPVHAVFLDGYQADLETRGELHKAVSGYQWPEADPEADSITLSKHGFRVIQSRVFKLFCFWNPIAHFRRDLRRLEDEALYRSSWIAEQLRETEDVALVAHWFFAYQRRMQKKVVSDDETVRFLAKGEGRTLYQNNLKTKSTFERVLSRLAGQDEVSTGAPDDQDMLALIDQTCVMMRAYVDIYGGGEKENLVFKKGVSGGTGRGPVDQYNLLCDILRELVTKAEEEGIKPLPGAVYKFLAKDIMSWNNAWGDDAFADGKEHGWEPWVRERGLDSTRYPARLT